MELDQKQTHPPALMLKLNMKSKQVSSIQPEPPCAPMKLNNPSPIQSVPKEQRPSNNNGKEGKGKVSVSPVMKMSPIPMFAPPLMYGMYPPPIMPYPVHYPVHPPPGKMITEQNTNSKVTESKSASQSKQVQSESLKKDKQQDDNNMKIVHNEETPAPTVQVEKENQPITESIQKDEDPSEPEKKKQCILSDEIVGTEESRRIWAIIDAAKREFEKTGRTGDVPFLNDASLMLKPKEERYLGHVTYTGCHRKVAYSSDPAHLQLFLLPKFNSGDCYSVLDIRIPFQYLTMDNNAVRFRALWGTDIYSDDSDIVAGILIFGLVTSVIIHCGSYIPFDYPLEQKIVHAEAPQPKEDVFEQPMKGKIDESDEMADHDLKVRVRILPKLKKYHASDRFGITSRSWGSGHDGFSIRVEKVEKIEKGYSIRAQKKQGAREWFNMARLVAVEMEKTENDLEEPFNRTEFAEKVQLELEKKNFTI